MRLAFRAESTVSRLTFSSFHSSRSWSPKGLHHALRFETLLDHGHDFALVRPHLLGRRLDGFLESRNQNRENGRYRHSEQPEIPVEPEHQTEHTDDGE